ncbi:MAG: 3-deoxy-7-phosphoheptulonate synthase [Planctomycetota bacterium]|mgnify:CR=1 FL=1
MIVVLKKDCPEEQIRGIEGRIRDMGYYTSQILGTERSVIAVIGPVNAVALDRSLIETLPGVVEVLHITKPYKLASREAKHENTRIMLRQRVVGADGIVILAGPSAMESKESLVGIAKGVRKLGVGLFHCAATRSINSPYSRQELTADVLKVLSEVREESGVTLITEVTTPADVKAVAKHADVLLVGNRNMQNFDLLRAAGDQPKPVILKRHMAATIEEFLVAAEFILSRGSNQNVILCERGIRTFESDRYSLDLSAVPIIKELTHLPVFVDPTRSVSGRAALARMAMSAVAAGADGLLLLVHTDPDKAVLDTVNTLSLDQFATLLADLGKLAALIGRSVDLTDAPEHAARPKR